MKSFLFSIMLLSSAVYAQDKAEIQQAYETFVAIDRQIEALIQEKLQLKEEIAEHLERGSTGLLPGVGRRQSREAGMDMQKMQELNQQLGELEGKRSDLLARLQ